MGDNEKLIINNMKYVLEDMGFKEPIVIDDKTLNEFVKIDKIENPAVSGVNNRIIIEVMDKMVWPAMGKKQNDINKSALTTFKAVIRHFKKTENNKMINYENEAKEAIKVVLRRRGFE